MYCKYNYKFSRMELSEPEPSQEHSEKRSPATSREKLTNSLETFLQELYVSSTKRQKMSISRSIVEAVRSLNPPGRFLEKDPNTGLWSDIGHKKAVEKTSQALRDGASNLRKQLSADLGDPDFINAVFDMDVDRDDQKSKNKDSEKGDGSDREKSDEEDSNMKKDSNEKDKEKIDSNEKDKEKSRVSDKAKCAKVRLMQSSFSNMICKIIPPYWIQCLTLFSMFWFSFIRSRRQ